MSIFTGSQDLKITSALDYASGTADRAGATLDMHGYDGVLMIVKLAAVEAAGTNSIKAQQDSASNMGTVADLEGTAITIADDDDNQTLVIDLYKPSERYVRVYVDKDTSHACAESAIYVQYGPGYRPQTNTVTDVLTIERHVTPAEGTA